MMKKENIILACLICIISISGFALFKMGQRTAYNATQVAIFEEQEIYGPYFGECTTLIVYEHSYKACAVEKDTIIIGAISHWVKK